MQRDVKVGLVLGVLLVAVVAVVFFRRDDNDRDKFSKLLPGPEKVADRARDMLGSSPSDPYPVAPEYLAESWQTPKSKSTRSPAAPRGAGDSVAQIESLDSSGNERSRSSGSVPAVLESPEFDSSGPGARGNTETLSARTRSPARGATEYTIQEGDTLSDIARRQLGSALLWTQIYEENKDILTDPGTIPAGQKIRIPIASRQDRGVTDRVASQDVYPGSTAPPRSSRASFTAEVAKPATDSAGSYVVKEGDTLTRIAKKHYGHESMYLQILNANTDQIENPGGIRPGMVLRLP